MKTKEDQMLYVVAIAMRELIVFGWKHLRVAAEAEGNYFKVIIQADEEQVANGEICQAPVFLEPVVIRIPFGASEKDGVEVYNRVELEVVQRFFDPPV